MASKCESLCHANNVNECVAKSKSGNVYGCRQEFLGHVDSEIDIAGFQGLDGMEVKKIKPQADNLQLALMIWVA